MSNALLLGWNTSFLEQQCLYLLLFMPQDWHPEVTRNYRSFSLDPTLMKMWDDRTPEKRWWQPLRGPQMMPTPHRTSDDANPSEDLRWCQPLRGPQMMPTPQRTSDDANPSEDLRWCQPQRTSDDANPSEDLRWCQPLRGSQMMPTPQRISDDANPSEDLRWCQPLRGPQMTTTLKQHTKLPNLAISLIATYKHCS